jgi:hypothetical protein
MKRNHLAIAAAAAFALSGASFTYAEDATAAPPGNPQPQGAVEKTEQGVRNEAAKVGIGSADKASEKMSPHAEAIHDVLAQVAEAAFTKDGVKDVVERFSKADRDRLDANKDAYKNDETLNGRIAELQKDWKDKYNQSFDIKDEDKVLGQQFASIDEAQAGDAARTASGTVTDSTVAPNPAPVDEQAKKDANAAAGAAAGASGEAAAKNRDAAVVRIPASHGMAALDVPLVHETMGWRIDIPDSVDGAKLKANIQTALTDIGNMKAQWAADPDNAYRAATHRVLLGIFDKQANEAGAAGAAAPGATDTTVTPSATPGATPGESK